MRILTSTMDNKEDPKVHCIVLNELPYDLVKGRTEWKLCKVFLSLSDSSQRIQREKRPTRKYKPVLVFSVSNPSDTDRQTLNFNKGVVKDCLGFSVNSETVAALIDGIGEKETQWVLTTSEYLKRFSMQENLTIDTFYKNKFEESKLQGSLPSLFKLQSVSNRTEVCLASPVSKPPTAEDRLKRLKPTSKGNECKGEKTVEKNRTTPKVVSKVVPSKSRDFNGNYPAAQSDEKRSDSQHQNVAKIPSKSRTSAGVHDPRENKGPSKLPSVPCLPSTTVPRKKPVSDSVVPNPDSIPKLKNPRKEPVGKYAETGAEVEACLDDKRDRASQSATDVTTRAGTSNSHVKRHTPDSGKDECGDIKRKKHTGGSTNSQSKIFLGKSQRASCRSLSVDSGSIKKTKEHPKICHEDKIAEMKSSSKAMQAKGKQTTKKGVLEKEGKPQSKTVRSHSVESGRTKTVKEIDKKISQEKIPLMKFSSNSEQAKGNDTANKGIFKNACRLDFRQTGEDNPSVTKKDDNKPEPHDQTTTSQADPESTGFDLLGSLNTKDSFLFNSENRKELSGVYNFMEAFVQSELYDLTDSSKVQTLNSTTIQSMSNDASLSHMKRGAVFSNQEPQYEDTKRPKTEERQAGKLPEIKQDVPRRGESNAEKRAERQSSPLHCENPCRLSHHRNTPVGKQEKQLQNAQEKHSSKKRSEVTLLVGDTMLQHIQPDKFFEKKHVVVRTVPGAKVDYVSKKVTDFVRQENPSSVILHVGTNYLQKLGILHIAEHIKSVGKLITETFPCVTKFTISSIIQRREDNTGAKCAKVSDVNKILRNIQLEHEWDYIDNENIDPEVHLGPDGIHLNSIGIEAFAANINKHLGMVQYDVQQAANNAGHVTKHQLPVHVTSEDNEKVGTSCEEDAAVTANISKCMDSDILPRRNTNQPFVPKDQPVANPETPIKDTDNTAALKAKIRPVTNSIPGKTNVEQEKVTLLIGDSMLESINPQKLSRTKQTELVVVPDARVDNIGETISDHARNPNFDEVILHIGSKDLKDDVYTHREIATKIEAIGLTLETTCPHITTFTISGVIETFDYKRANSRNLNTLFKSSTLDHGWPFICNDNIYPTFHMRPFETKLNSCGTRRLALNIIEHLQYVKSERFKSVSQAPAMHGNNDQSSFKDSRPMDCQELVVPWKILPEDPQADKRPPKNLKADRLPRKDLSSKKSCDDRVGFNAGTGNEPLDGETGCSDRDRGQSQTCDEGHLKPSRRKKHKLHKTNRKTDGSLERPNSKSWSYGANQNHSGHYYKHSSAQYWHSTTHGPKHVQNAHHQNSLSHHARGYSRCFCCGELGHKKANCPRRR